MRKFLSFLFAVVFLSTVSFGQVRSDATQIRVNKTVKQTRSINDISCPAGSLFSNNLTAISGGSVSEKQKDMACASVFDTPGGTIETMTVWGITAVYDPQTHQWSACDEADPMGFDIYFCENNGGTMGDTLYTFEGIEATTSATGEKLGSYDVQQYDITLPADVDLASGFVIVQGNTNNDCWYLWVTSDEGDAGINWDGTKWSESGNFTMCLGGTLPDCPAPTHGVFTNVTNITADAQWIESGSATAWEYELVTSGTTPTGTGIAADADHVSLSDLVPSTDYDFYVRSKCADDSYSVWKGPYSFRTNACPDDYTCEMQFVIGDSYGDDWNGGYISVVEDDYEIAQVASDGRTGKEDTIIYVSICNDADIKLNFVPGDYPEEMRFTVIDYYYGTDDADTLYLTDKADTILITNLYTGVYDCPNIESNPEGISTVNVSSNFKIYPNPTTGLVKVEGAEGSQIIIYNMIGEVVYTENNTSATTTIDLSSFNAGNYIVKIINNNEVATQKIVLTK